MLDSTAETIRIRVVVFSLILLILTVLRATGLLQVGGLGGGPLIVR
jgi:hypothetical protein